MIHVLCLPSWYPESLNEQAGSFFRTHALALKSEGAKVGVLSIQEIPLSKFFKKKPKLHSKLKFFDDGIPTYQELFLNFPPRVNRISRARKIWIARNLFSEYVLENGLPDIIHVQSALDAGSIAVDLKARYGVPFVVHEHSSLYSRQMATSSDLTETKKIFDASAAVHCVSRALEKDLANIFSSAIFGEPVPNSVDPRFLQQPVANTAKETFRFLHVSDLSENKNVKLLLDGFKEAFYGKENVVLRIVGGGYDRFKRYASKLGIDQQVEFTGKKNRQEIVEDYVLADAFVFTSNVETFGVVVIEAMAMGLPVISTASGGPDDLVMPSTGILIDPENVFQLKKAMQNMFDKTLYFDKHNIRLLCERKFSDGVVARNWLQLYKKYLALV